MYFMFNFSIDFLNTIAFGYFFFTLKIWQHLCNSRQQLAGTVRCTLYVVAILATVH